MSIENSLTIISVAIVLLACLVAYVLLRIIQVMKVLLNITNTINTKLPAILHNIEKVTCNISDATDTAKQNIKSFSAAITTMKTAFVLMGNKENVVAKWIRLICYLPKTKSILKGVVAFLQTYNQYPKHDTSKNNSTSEVDTSIDNTSKS
ncbi:MAG: hypothetical protein WCJ49_01505 [Deltaproteobacteria bacterium]